MSPSCNPSSTLLELRLHLPFSGHITRFCTATATMSSHPPSFLIQPSRPTTATTSSDTSTPPHRFLPAPAQLPSPAPPPALTGPIPNLLPIFTKSAPIPGTVLIKVEHTTFLCHSEILALGSPFFEALLTGDWKEMAKKETKRMDQRRESELEVLREGLDQEGDGEDDTPASKRDSFRTAGTSTSVTSIDQEEEQDFESVPLATPRLGDPNFGADEDTTSEPGDIAPSMTASYLSSVVDDYEDSDAESDDGGHDDSIICRLRLKEEQASSSSLSPSPFSFSRSPSCSSLPGFSITSLPSPRTPSDLGQRLGAPPPGLEIRRPFTSQRCHRVPLAFLRGESYQGNEDCRR